MVAEPARNHDPPTGQSPSNSALGNSLIARGFRGGFLVSPNSCWDGCLSGGLGAFVVSQRLMSGLLVIKDLAKLPHVDLLSAYRTDIEVF